MDNFVLNLAMGVMDLLKATVIFTLSSGEIMVEYASLFCNICIWRKFNIRTAVALFMSSQLNLKSVFDYISLTCA